MTRHVIVEGCDGSGKDTLIKSLGAYKLWPTMVSVHPRASTSLGGPIDNLAQWVTADLRDIEDLKPPGMWIYNRHPLISEPIYGRFRPDKPTHPAFDDQEWLSLQRARMARYSVLVIVQPPYSEVNRILHAQGPEAHMPGVFENRRAIYDAYRNFRWPGPVIRYNRTAIGVPSLTRQLVTAIQEM